MARCACNVQSEIKVCLLMQYRGQGCRCGEIGPLWCYQRPAGAGGLRCGEACLYKVSEGVRRRGAVTRSPAPGLAGWSVVCARCAGRGALRGSSAENPASQYCQ